MTTLLRLLALAILAAIVVVARLATVPGFEAVRDSGLNTRVHHTLGWLGPGLGPWILGCIGAHFLGQVGGGWDPRSAAGRLKLIGLASAITVGLCVVSGMFLSMGLAQTAHALGVPLPPRGQVVLFQVGGTFALIALAQVATSLRLGDGVVWLMLFDMSVLAWAEAGAPAARAGLVVALALLTGAMWVALRPLQPVTLRQEKRVARVRVPLPPLILPLFGANWFGAQAVMFLGVFAPGLARSTTVTAAVWVGVFLLACPFFTFFFASLSVTPGALTERKIGYGKEEPGQASAQAFESWLNLLTAKVAVALTLLGGIPLALAMFLDVQVALLALLVLLLGAALVDLVDGHRHGLPDSVVLTESSRFLEASHLRDRLRQAEVPCLLSPGHASWLLFWDFAPRWRTSVLVAREQEEQARQVLEGFQEEWAVFALTPTYPLVAPEAPPDEG